MRTKFDIRAFCRCIAAATATVWLATGTANAAPVTASFTGTVTGGRPSAPALLEYPLGTPVSWEFSFDDAFLAVSPADDVFGAGSQPATGWATVGTETYALNFARLWAYATVTEDSIRRIVSYAFVIEGIGPTSPRGGVFDGLWVSFDATLALLTSSIAYMSTATSEGPFGSRILNLDGAYRVTRSNSVAEPTTAWLLLAAVAMLARRRLSVTQGI